MVEMATNLDFNLDVETLSQEFTGNFWEGFNASGGFDYGLGRLEVEPSALDRSAPSIHSWPSPSTGLNPWSPPSLSSYDAPTSPPITTANEDLSMVRSMLPPPKAASRLAPSEHSAEEWESQRSIFTQLYLTEGKSLKEVMETMESKYGFRATPRQYKRRIEQWKLDKNIKESDMRVILRKDLKRKREGKKSEFRISGREIEPKKIQRFAQRYKVTEETILDFNVETPCYIDCDTPAPIIEDEAIQHHTREEDSTKVSTTLPLPGALVNQGQDRETVIANARKMVLDRFIREPGLAIPSESAFDLSVLKYSPELDGVSDEVVNRWIRYRLHEFLFLLSPDIRSEAPDFDIPLSSNNFPHDHDILLKKSDLISRSILLLGFWLFKQNFPEDNWTKKDFEVICEGHIFEYLLRCCVAYHCKERGSERERLLWSHFTKRVSIPCFEDFLNFEYSMSPMKFYRLRYFAWDLFSMEMLRIDDWNDFVGRAKREVNLMVKSI
ncbi:hypothetical protein ACHAO1_004337 [Botrytis cinerea]